MGPSPVATLVVLLSVFGSQAASAGCTCSGTMCMNEQGQMCEPPKATAAPAPATSGSSGSPSGPGRAAAPVSAGVRAAAVQLYQQASSNSGIALNALAREPLETGADVIAALAKLKEEASHGTDDRARTVGAGTIDGIISRIRSDADYSSRRSEVESIPKMLNVEIAIQTLNAKPGGLTDKDKQSLAELQRQYGELMPKSAPQPQVRTAQAAAYANPAALTPAQTAAAAADKPLMSLFHDSWSKAVDNWNSQHPAGGTTPNAPPNPGEPAGPAPAPPGQWSPAPPQGHLGDMIQNDPGDPDPWRYSADSKMARRDYAGALGDAQKAVDLGGGAPARLALGQAKYGLGDYAGAYADARRVLDAEPGNKSATALLHFAEDRAAPAASGASAGARGGAGFSVDAAAALRAELLSGALGAGPAAARAPLEEAKSLLRVGDLSGARRLLARALERDPRDAEAYALTAMIAARQRDYAAALEAADRGLALDPRRKSLLSTKAYALVRAGRWTEARAAAEVLLAVDPKDPYGYAYRANAEGRLGDRAAMLEDLHRAAALDPRFVPLEKEALQLPSDKDLRFLFPGEQAATAAAGAASAGRGRSFGAIAGAAAIGGLLLALALLRVVLPGRASAPSAFARRDETAAPTGLIRGQYEIARPIGAGGMGMVFEGTDRSLGRRVAIKKMRDELKMNPQERARFVIEAKTVAALHHPGIVDIYAIADEGDEVYLIFEFVDGRTVHDLVQRAGRLPPAEAARVVRAAADALGYAHAKGVIHRDMKPSNVMVDSAGRVKVMDFGIARMAKDAMTRYSMTNTVVGTPPYMAPEQEQGHVRRESDVYALAVCAYEMLTGKLPFVGIGAGMLMNKINMSFVPPSRATAGLPEALDAAFARAFEADPDRRFRTPQEFASTLEAAVGAPPPRVRDQG